ncbi:CBS domain-containing protein [Streptomyces sp. NPDC059575]|uniref:CBS domain-containing protein n=1 Tax=Streptomyces sp. NPDC059575 TaxID=3346872 RepID=UPI00367BE6A7
MRRLAVVEDDGHPVGVVSLGDLARAREPGSPPPGRPCPRPRSRPCPTTAWPRPVPARTCSA